MDSAPHDPAVAPTAGQGQGCILLFGMPRSGTTWLGKLFDSHPDTLYRHEPDSWRRLDMPRYPALADSTRYAAQLRAFEAGLPQINALRVAGKRPLFAKSYLSPMRSRLIDISVRLARIGSQLYPEFPVLMHCAGDGHPCRRVVWKSIESLGRTGVLLEALTDARAIQILRHPCGYIASVQRGLQARQFSDNTSGSGDYGIFKAAIGTPLGDRYELNMDKLRALTPEERLAWRWVLINEKVMLDCDGSARWLAVRYEDVCSEPASTVQRLFEFAGLEMSDQTRAFIDASTGRNKGGYYSVFKNPLSAAWRWREELDTQTIARVMAIVERTRVGAYYADTPAGEAVAS